MARVGYEWDAETEIGGEIVDHDFRDKLIEVPNLGPGQTLVLVRTTEDGDRSWAYVKDGVLPVYFSIPCSDGEYHETGVAVPKRFHQEFSRLGK